MDITLKKCCVLLLFIIIASRWTSYTEQGAIGVDLVKSKLEASLNHDQNPDDDRFGRIDRSLISDDQSAA